jgi:hypothetical protein
LQALSMIKSPESPTEDRQAKNTPMDQHTQEQNKLDAGTVVLHKRRPAENLHCCCQGQQQHSDAVNRARALTFALTVKTP